MKAEILNLISQIRGNQKRDYTDNNITNYIDGQDFVIEELEKLLKKDFPMHEFEVGDVAFCPYYNKKGIISSIKPTQNPDIIPYHIRLVNPTNPNDYCVTKLKTDSASSPYPQYLQLICKKKDYEEIAEKIMFDKK